MPSRNVMIDDRGDPAIGIDVEEPILLLDARCKVDEMNDVLQAGLGQHDRNLAGISAQFFCGVIVNHFDAPWRLA